MLSRKRVLQFNALLNLMIWMYYVVMIILVVILEVDEEY